MKSFLFALSLVSLTAFAGGGKAPAPGMYQCGAGYTYRIIFPDCEESESVCPHYKQELFPSEWRPTLSEAQAEALSRCRAAAGKNPCKLHALKWPWREACKVSK